LVLTTASALPLLLVLAVRAHRIFQLQTQQMLSGPLGMILFVLRITEHSQQHQRQQYNQYERQHQRQQRQEC
jgi:hypothetical protein